MIMTAERPDVGLAFETEVDRPIPVTRRRGDHLLISAGAAVAVVLVAAGSLLTWGNDFAQDYVSAELTSQQITTRGSEEALVAQGREDLVPFAGQQVTTGEEPEAYASYIDGHLEETAGGLTYAEIPDREAHAAVREAIDSGSSGSGDRRVPSPRPTS